MTFWTSRWSERWRPHSRLSPLARRLRLALLVPLLCFAAVEVAPAQGRFKYRIDPSRGDRAVRSQTHDRHDEPDVSSQELWFGRPRQRGEQFPAAGDQADGSMRVLDGGGAVIGLPWKQPAEASSAEVESSRMLELDPGQIIVAHSSIHLADDGNYVIDLYIRVVGPAPPAFVTVTGFTKSGEGFASPEIKGVAPFHAWKEVTREGSRQFLMSFSLPEHYSMRRYDYYMVKFYDADGFNEAELPRE